MKMSLASRSDGETWRCDTFILPSASPTGAACLRLIRPREQARRSAELPQADLDRAHFASQSKRQVGSMAKAAIARRSACPLLAVVSCEQFSDFSC